MDEFNEEMMVDDNGYLTDEAFEEEFDPNAPLIPNGPSNEVIEMWKQAYGSIYFTEFDDEVYVWRTITRTEYKTVMNVQPATKSYREEKICGICVLYPDGYNSTVMAGGKAGVPSVLAEQIMDKSGFLPNGTAKKL